MSQSEDIEDVLSTYGIHEGWPDRRHQMATTLAGHGWSDEDVELLCQHVAKTSRDPGAAAAAVLSDLSKARARLMDLRRCRKIAPQAATEPAVVEPGDRARMRRMAYALVEADNRSRAEACAIIGVDVDELERLIREERELRMAPD